MLLMRYIALNLVAGHRFPRAANSDVVSEGSIETKAAAAAFLKGSSDIVLLRAVW